ncbi:MAG: 30S ribosomal protein S20 [Clostridia bacterium]|nr:30S ribosomal protein S20 [Clostridia bacterium]
MPNIKSAKKRVLITKKKTLRNQMIKSAIHTALKKADAAIVAGDQETAKAAVIYASKKMDQAVAKGVFHKNTIARKKSALAKRFNKMA